MNVGERWSSATSKPNSSSQQPVCLASPPAMPDGAGALDPGDLADGRSHRSGGGCDDHRLARLRSADLEQAGVRREAGHAEHPHAPWRRAPTDGSSLRRALAVRDRVRLPAGVGEHHVAGLEDGSRDSSTTQTVPPTMHVADRHRVGVRLRVAHPAAHVGVQREVDDPQQHLAVVEIGEIVVLEGEGVVVGFALGAAGESDLGGGGHVELLEEGGKRGSTSMSPAVRPPGGGLSGRWSARGVQGVGDLDAPGVGAATDPRGLRRGRPRPRS